MLSHTNNNWIKKTPMRSARSHCSVAVLNGKIYVFGGGGSEFSSQSSVAVYNPGEDAWEEKKEMPSLRSGAAAIAVGDRIYVIGGGFRQETGIFQFKKTVEIYHPGTDTWEKGPDMLMPHDYPAIAFLNGFIYIMGGHHPDATKGGPKTDPGFNFCERLKLAEGIWEEIDQLPTPRFALSGAVFEEKIIATGGVALTDKGFNNFNIIETFDPASGKWKKETDFSLPWPAAGHGSCMLDKKLFIFGGYSGESIHDRAACYDTEKKIWNELPPLPVPTAAMGIGLMDTAIYIIGGWAEDGKTPLNTVSAYILSETHT